MKYNTLASKAVILENPTQARKAFHEIRKYKMLVENDDNTNRQNLTYPCYVLINELKKGKMGVYIVSINNEENLDDPNSVLSLGYFPISLFQFKEALEEVFGER